MAQSVAKEVAHNDEVTRCVVIRKLIEIETISIITLGA